MAFVHAYVAGREGGRGGVQLLTTVALCRNIVDPRTHARHRGVDRMVPEFELYARYL